MGKLPFSRFMSSPGALLSYHPARFSRAFHLALIVVLSAIAAPAFALDARTELAGYLLQGWQTEHGLPSNKVRALVQTRDGYLWLGTPQGLARFDGHRFEILNQANHPEL